MASTNSTQHTTCCTLWPKRAASACMQGYSLAVPLQCHGISATGHSDSVEPSKPYGWPDGVPDEMQSILTSCAELLCA